MSLGCYFGIWSINQSWMRAKKGGGLCVLGGNPPGFMLGRRHGPKTMGIGCGWGFVVPPGRGGGQDAPESVKVGGGADAQRWAASGGQPCGAGATRGFGVPGESYLAVLDALHDVQGTLDFVLCRNEGGAAFMASAWGKLTGKPGLCFVTRGPGVTNASIGVHTAMQDSSPMILFVGQVGTDMIGREAFQEIDYPAVFGTMAKWAVEIDRGERIPEILSRAWVTATTGRPGPCGGGAARGYADGPDRCRPPARPGAVAEAAPEPGAMAAALAVLAGAERPLILMGGANWTSAGRAMMQGFAEASDIPVVAVFRYQDQFDNHSPCLPERPGSGCRPM